MRNVRRGFNSDANRIISLFDVKDAEINWFESGLIFLNQGASELAIQCLRRGIGKTGPHLELYRALAIGWTQISRPAKAMEVLLQANVLSPQNPLVTEEIDRLSGQIGGLFNLSQVNWSRVRNDYDPQGAFAGLTSAIAISQADSLQGSGRLGAALHWCLKAIVLAPDDELHQTRAADLLIRTGRAADGQNFLKRAAEKRPTAAAFHKIGGIAQELHDFTGAKEAYDRALELKPDFVPALCAAGHLLQDQGELKAADTFLLKAQEISPDPLVRIVIESALPPIYESVADLNERRIKLEYKLNQLVEDNVIIDPSLGVVPTTFYTAYHGLNDKSIAAAFGKIYQPKETANCQLRPNWSNRKLRVGILSKFFCRHTIGRLNLGTVQNLSREQFEVIVLSARRPDDPYAHEFRKAADEFVVLPDGPTAVLERIRQLELDILFFTDIGMDPLTYSLAFVRSAPIQCVTWGHPVTTGSPVMDYFISSERLEIPEAQGHYTEELVKLPELAVYYPRPVLPADAPSRQHFGFSDKDHLYGCPQTLFKFHPEFDEILSSILQRDRNGRLVLIEGRHPSWTAKLRSRLEKRLGNEIDRVHFLPRLSWQEFMGVTHFVDVLLDPLHFGGGNTSYEALALGKPVVSLPGDFLRSRITLALYDRMGFDECLVQSADQYVELALRLGIDRDYSKHVSARILESNHVLFEDLTGIRQLEGFWTQAVRRAAGSNTTRKLVVQEGNR